jgi:hypothetical protein
MKKRLLPFLFSCGCLVTTAQTTGNIPSVPGAPSAEEILGLAPINFSSSPQVPANKQLFFNSNAFATNANAGPIPPGPFTFKLNNTSTYTSLSTLSNQYIVAGGWGKDKWYGALYPDNVLVTVDTLDGTVTPVGAMPPVSGELWTGISYDRTAQVLYAVSGSNTNTTLYTVDVTTGAASPMGSAPGIVVVCMGASKTGTLYGVDVLSDKFGSISKSDGSWTEIGSIGFDAQYAQDMEFDLSTDTCFYACYNLTAGQAELRTVDLSTGATTVVSAFPAGSQIVGFAIPYVQASGIEANDGSSFAHLTSYPNPCSSQTTLSWSLTEADHLTLDIVDICGKKTVSLYENEKFLSGNHTITIDASDLAPGTYFFRIQSRRHGIKSDKLVVVK